MWGMRLRIPHQAAFADGPHATPVPGDPYVLLAIPVTTGLPPKQHPLYAESTIR